MALTEENRYKGGGSFKKHCFTLKDIARERGKTLAAVRRDLWRNKFDPGDLHSLIMYLLREKGQHKRPKLSDHDRLVLRGDRWLKQQNFKVVIRDQCQAYTNNGEQPDIIGWRDGLSVLIECKYSRADFLSDNKKVFRQAPEQGMGDWRFYMCPPEVIKVKDLPAGWGLLWVYPKKISKVHGFPQNTMWHHDKPFRGDKFSETQILVSALRRLVIRGHLEEIYKDMDE